MELEKEAEKRKRAEEALRTSQEYARNVIDSSLDMIISVDADRYIVEFNKAAEETFGYRREEVVGTLVGILYADPQEGLAVHKKTVEQGQCVQEILNRRKSGEVFPSFLSASQLRDPHGEVVGVMGVSRDITERKKSEERIKASLKEKEVMLKEIHHRVKNNLQVISSLLNLQSGYIKDREALEMFKESQNRVRSMAFIHEKLYQSEDLARIDIAGYIQDLTTSLFRSYTASAPAIKLNIDVKDIFLDINTSIPCGLIINELVSNSLKHAFPDGREGEIKIAMHRINENKIELIVSDNGIGFPKDIDFRSTESLGMQVVTTLVEQLDGTIELDRSKGTAFRIRFSQ